MFYPIKGPDEIDVFPIKPDRTEGRWRVGKNKMKELLKNNLVHFELRDDGIYEAYRIIEEGKESFSAIDSILSIEEVSTTAHGSKEIKSLFDGIQVFDYPKPTKLLKYLINLEESDDAIILDYFAGSGTTAHAVMELNKEDNGNRKFILVQLPEKTSEDSEAYKAKYLTIADICKERIRRIIQKLSQKADGKNEKEETQTELELSEGHSELVSESSEKLKQSVNQVQDKVQLDIPGFKVFKLSPSNFKHWRSDLIESDEDLNKMIDLFDTQLKPGAQELNMLYELMLKSGYTLTDKIEEKNGFYLVADKLAVVLNKIDQTVIDDILKHRPQTCIILDTLFADNDQLKTNTALQMKDAGVELVTV